MTHFTLVLLVELLVIVSLVALVTRWLRTPYTVALVVAGLGIAILHPFQVELTPELILGLFLPPLLFEAALHLNLADLRRDAPIILTLAVPGVVVTMLIVGALLAWLGPVNLAEALVFGALIATTDPVAVVALLRATGVPKRLRVLLEAESLLNDGTAVVVFNLALVAALTGEFSLAQGASDLLRVSVGGLAVGLGLGWLTAQVIARVDDYLIEITLTTVLAFGAYLLAERLGFSGVLAVVAAGLLSGSLGLRNMSPTTRIVLFNFWEYAAFVANSLVFLLIGLTVNLPALLAAWAPILLAVGTVLAARAIVIYGVGWLARRWKWIESIPAAWQHVLGWGGLRGAVSLALVLSLPEAFGPSRGLLQVMAFGVVLFTLLIEGTTMGPLVRWLKLSERSAAQHRYELQHGQLAALRAAGAHLEQLLRDGLVSPPVGEILKAELSAQTQDLAAQVTQTLQSAPALEARELRANRRELFRAQRSTLLRLRGDGALSDEAYDQLTTVIDEKLLQEAAQEDVERKASGPV
jgi:monovalent cation:H+ antiporter, CPA1 family